MAVTEQQVKELESAFKTQFYYIVQGLGFWWGLYNKAAKMSPGPAKDKLVSSIESYGNKTLIPLMVKWVNLAKYLRNGGVQVPLADVGRMFDRDYYLTLAEVVKNFNADKPASGSIGFIPLIIWGVIALAGMFTVESITNQINSTTAQQKELIDSTNKLCKDNGLSTEECKKILSDTQTTIQTTDSNKGGGLFSSFGTLLLWGAGIWGFTTFILPEIRKNKSQPKAA